MSMNGSIKLSRTEQYENTISQTEDYKKDL